MSIGKRRKIFFSFNKNKFNKKSNIGPYLGDIFLFLILLLIPINNFYQGLPLPRNQYVVIVIIYPHTQSKVLNMGDWLAKDARNVRIYLKNAMNVGIKIVEITDTLIIVSCR